MKYADYMKDHESENLDWCTPYTDDSGEYMLILCNGKVTYLSSPLGDIDCEASPAVPAEALHDFAKAVNPDYDMYSGYTDTQIAIIAMQPVGCVYCPCFGCCEAMDDDLGWNGDDFGNEY